MSTERAEAVASKLAGILPEAQVSEVRKIVDAAIREAEQDAARKARGEAAALKGQLDKAVEAAAGERAHLLKSAAESVHAERLACLNAVKGEKKSLGPQHPWNVALDYAARAIEKRGQK